MLWIIVILSVKIVHFPINCCQYYVFEFTQSLISLITGDYESALEEHNKELHISEALEDIMGAGVAHRKIGECFCELGKYNKALKHQKLHLQVLIFFNTPGVSH